VVFIFLRAPVATQICLLILRLFSYEYVAEKLYLAATYYSFFIFILLNLLKPGIFNYHFIIKVPFWKLVFILIFLTTTKSSAGAA